MTKKYKTLECQSHLHEFIAPDVHYTLDGSEPVKYTLIAIDDASGYLTINKVNQEGAELPVYTFTQTNTEWARIDKDMNVVHLDMDKCFAGPHNNYTVLAKAIWNEAITAAMTIAYGAGDDQMYEQLRGLKKK